MSQRGFTIIELLIVIAIIVALASVVIAAVGDARTDGVVTKMTAEMNGLSKRAVILQNQSFSFAEVCGSDGSTQDAQIINFVTSLDQFSSGTTTCNSSVSAFAVSVPLPPDSVEHWCVDSGGGASMRSSPLPSGEFSCS